MFIRKEIYNVAHSRWGFYVKKEERVKIQASVIRNNVFFSEVQHAGNLQIMWLWSMHHGRFVLGSETEAFVNLQYYEEENTGSKSRNAAVNGRRKYRLQQVSQVLVGFQK